MTFLYVETLTQGQLIKHAYINDKWLVLQGPPELKGDEIFQPTVSATIVDSPNICAKFERNC